METLAEKENKTMEPRRKVTQIKIRKTMMLQLPMMTMVLKTIMMIKLMMVVQDELLILFLHKMYLSKQRS